MSINFNEKINRLNTGNIKWDNYGEDYIPLWVADMDFKSPDSSREKNFSWNIWLYKGRQRINGNNSGAF